MMASTNFLVFDEGKQNMMSDGDYSANTQRARGVTPGIAYPNLHNKLYYQVSVMAKAIADFMVAQGANANDEDVEQLTADISTAFTNFVDNKTKDVYLPLSGGTVTGILNINSIESIAGNILLYFTDDQKSFGFYDNNTSSNVLWYRNNDKILRSEVPITAPTPSGGDNSTKVATTAFVQSLLTQKFTASKEQNGWWKDGNTGLILQWVTNTPYFDVYSNVVYPTDDNGQLATINFPINFNVCLIAIPVFFLGDNQAIETVIAINNISNTSVTFRIREFTQIIQDLKIGCLAIGY